jgi:hypothetical protein
MSALPKDGKGTSDAQLLADTLRAWVEAKNKLAWLEQEQEILQQINERQARKIFELQKALEALKTGEGN